MRLSKRISFVRDGNVVLRDHSTPMINHGGYTNGRHMGGCAQLAFIFFPDSVTVPLLQYLLFHDTYEQITGDVNGWAKGKYPALGVATQEIEDDLDRKWEFLPTVTYEVDEPGFTECEYHIFHFIDKVDHLMVLSEQRKMGNRADRLELIYHRLQSIVQRQLVKLEELCILTNARALEIDVALSEYVS